MQVLESDWAWLAGIFEGEGCITFRNQHSVRVTIAMTDKDVIDHIHKLVPGNRGVKHTPPYKDTYFWDLSHKEKIEPFLRSILPWLHTRRRQRAEAALERLQTCAAYGSSHCRQGHKFTPSNTYIRKNGRRACRACHALKQQEYRHRDASCPPSSE